MIFIRRTLRRFRHAWEGLMLAFREEPSFRIQLLAGLFIVVFALLFPLERWERGALFLVIGGVLVLELINSIVERLVDIIKPRVHAYARDVKDLGAAAVFVMACTAVVLAIYIFWPHIPLLINL